MVAYWTLARVSLDQGTCLASKSPSGCRPDIALSRLRSAPGEGRLMVYGVCTVLLNVYLPHTLSLYWKTTTKMLSPHSFMDNHNYYHNGICLLKQHCIIADLLSQGTQANTYSANMYTYLQLSLHVVQTSTSYRENREQQCV